MRKLSPNTGDGFVLVGKNHVFVYVTDYGLKKLLREIIVGPGQHHWGWIEISANKPIDLSDIGDRYSTFDHALNRAVNDSYCSVYEIDDFNELVEKWNSIEYSTDTITTVYSSEKLK